MPIVWNGGLTAIPVTVVSFNGRQGIVVLLSSDVLAAVTKTGTGSTFVLDSTPTIDTPYLSNRTKADYIYYTNAGSLITPTIGIAVYVWLSILRMTNDAGQTIGFDFSLLSAAASREYKWPDKNGTVAMLSDIPATGVTSFNTRTGAVVLLSADVVAALAYTPAANNQTMFIGTTSVAINRASGTLNLAGIGTLGTTGALTVANNTATIGLTTGNTSLNLNGGVATNGGSKLTFVNNGASIFVIGNYSSIVGGTYNALPTIYLPGGVLCIVGALLVNSITPVTGATGVDVQGSIGSSSLTASQLVIADANKVMTGLAAGTNGQALTVVGGVPSWQNRLISASGVLGPGAGTGATINVVSVNEDTISISIVTGTAPTGSYATILDITVVSNVIAGQPFPVFSASNLVSAGISGTQAIYMEGSGVKTFRVISGLVGLGAGLNYAWYVKI